MNIRKLKKCDYLKFMQEQHIAPETLEIYPCVDGEHFVVKQGKRKIVLKMEDYKDFLMEVNLIVCNYIDMEIEKEKNNGEHN